MAVESLRTHLIDELTDLLSAEQQIVEALPKMAGAASSRQLRSAFQKHLKETRGHITRLSQVFKTLGEKPRSKTCEGMEGLLAEAEEMMRHTPEGSLRDAVMITGAQKVEHYEMASYGTLRTYAEVIGENAVARLLEQTLKEEKAADQTLTKIAEAGINEEAAEAWQTEIDEGGLAKGAEWVGSAVGAAAGKIEKGVKRFASAVGMAQDRSPKNKKSGGTKRSRKK
jgi:ferritin-like metal-binding protein YciE